MNLRKGDMLVALVSSILSPTGAAALWRYMIPIAREFADQLVLAMNLPEIARPFVWLGAVLLVILFVEVLLALLCFLIKPKPNKKY